MTNFGNNYVVQLGLGGAILLLLLATAFFVVRKLRDSAVSDVSHSPELLSNFQEMRVQGDISDSEFRTIQSLLQQPASSRLRETQDAT